MADTIEEIAIGSATSLVQGDLTIDFTNPSVTGTLSTLVGGVQVPVTSLSIQTANGVTTVSGATPALTNVVVSFAGQNPTMATGTVTALGVAPVTVQEAAAIVCYASGTRFRTINGDVAVEDLAVGDMVVTASGEQRPIRWLGHRSIDCRTYPNPDDVMPVRVSAHAFAENCPMRDLLVSPGHSLCVDVAGEVLIPAVSLVNGATITQENVDEVTYWHVELESHDILMAENLPAESYLEMGNRTFFAEARLIDLSATPDDPVVARTHADFCRPFHVDGPVVAVVRAQFAARAKKLGWHLEQQGFGGVHLLVDGSRLDPEVRGNALRFNVPAGAEDVWLVSATSMPPQLATSNDRRKLGISVDALSIDDGFAAPRHVAVDDPRLGEGFHSVEQDGPTKWRWSAGRARLPASLWEGVDVDFYLRVDCSSPPLPLWVAPTATEDAAAAPRLSLVA